MVGKDLISIQQKDGQQTLLVESIITRALRSITRKQHATLDLKRLPDHRKPLAAGNRIIREEDPISPTQVLIPLTECIEHTHERSHGSLETVHENKEALPLVITLVTPLNGLTLKVTAEANHRKSRCPFPFLWARKYPIFS
jgi:hypothetical protein